MILNKIGGVAMSKDNNTKFVVGDEVTIISSNSHGVIKSIISVFCINALAHTMYKNDGVGLAAPQVGILKRIVVIETEPGKVIELINPKIIAFSGEQTGEEGCLSVPGKQGLVKRPSYVRVRALDRNGVMQTYEGTDLLARCFCHEIDHLDGILYKERLVK